jgi:hypothetical protein
MEYSAILTILQSEYDKATNFADVYWKSTKKKWNFVSTKQKVSTNQKKICKYESNIMMRLVVKYRSHFFLWINSPVGVKWDEWCFPSKCCNGQAYGFPPVVYLNLFKHKTELYRPEKENCGQITAFWGLPYFWSVILKKKRFDNSFPQPFCLELPAFWNYLIIYRRK